MKIKRSLGLIGITIGSLVLGCIILLALSVPISKWSENPNPIPIQRHQHYYITNAQVLDSSENKLAFKLGVLEIKNGYIKNVFFDNFKPLLPEIKQFNANGMYLLPGLIDSHVHIFDQADLFAYIRYGVTSVRNMMGFPIHLTWKDRIKRGELIGPNLITASPTLNAGNGGGPFHKKINSPEQVKELVIQYQQQGYDFIKFYDGLDKASYNALSSTAQASSFQYAGHPVRQIPLEDLLRSSPTSLEHIEELFHGPLDYKFDKEKTTRLIKSLKAANQMIVPTMTAYENIYMATFEQGKLDLLARLAQINPLIGWIAERQLDPATHPDHQKWIKDKRVFLHNLAKQLYLANVPMALGTDTGPAAVIAGLSVHEELALLSEIGFSNEYLIKMATTQGANLLNQADITGQIKNGTRADLILVSENPFDDISALKAPEAVVIFGQYLSQQELKQLELASMAHQSIYETTGIFVDHLLKL